MTRRLPVRSLIAASAVALLAVTGCAGPRSAGTDGMVELTLGHGAAPGNPRTLGAEEFKQIVESESGGKMKIQILGQETVGSDPEMLTSVQNGALDLSINSQGPFASYVPEIQLVGLPFLFESSEHAYSVIDSGILDGFTDDAESKGLVVLNYWDNGMREITNSKHPINVPADLAGLKIRTPDDPMTLAIFNALGSNPTPMAFGELYLSLRQGAVDGQENPVVNIKSAKLDEVQQHLAVTGHQYQVNPFVASKIKWETLTDEQRDILRRAADEALVDQRQMMLDQSAEIYQEFEKTLDVTHPDKAPFREMTQSVYDDSQTEFPDFYSDLTQAADQGRTEFAEDNSHE
ncbi:TRAP transporter substrate-binding protein [Brevibacterium sp.]|uniref:TRAP transporter substrate-binding protein n=1 Tax=Brevibacterium sp. TaxID=1701 RepID=UPI002812402F|nr:TRAP transporter substrate-binding protein [Brevibacterium sp.]